MLKLPHKLTRKNPSATHGTKEGERRRAGNKFRLTRPGSILVFETSGCALYGTVVSGGATGTIGHGPVGTSRATDCDQAIEEVVAQLQAGGKGRLPKNAILITPAASGELLELPVDPKNRKAAKNVGEMARWEMEEHFLALGDVWTLGALLMGCGYIDAAQRREVETGSGGRGLALNGAYSDLVGRERVGECMEFLEKLLGEEGELLSGVVPQPDEDQLDRFTWWGAGINEGICRRWVEACRHRNIHLSWIYPQLGASLPLIDERKTSWLLADVRQEQVALFQFRLGRLETVAFRSTDYGEMGGETLFQAIRAILHQDTRTVYLSAPEEQASNLAKELRSRLQQQEVVLLSERYGVADPTSCPVEIHLSMLGCGRHALRHVRQNYAVRIPAQKPKPPLWKNRDLYPWLGIALIVGSVVSVDITLHKRAAAMEWELELAEIEYRKQMDIKQEAQKIAGELKALEDRLAAKEAELKEEEHLHYILNEVIRYRQELAPAILGVIGKSINEEVVLDLLEEDADRVGFYIEGWALHDTQGQVFVNTLGSGLAPLKYKVEEVKVEKGTGRYGLDGFHMKIWLRKTEDGVKGDKKAVGKKEGAKGKS